ncbi:MAG TPA: hypothetical protein VGB17_16460 [Pyrinomonadaceae bacterium]|jgi:hypothetical protein
MAWENRNGREYYYRKERSGDTVRSVYVGAGPAASLAASMDQREQATRKKERTQIQLERAKAAREEAHLDEIDQRVKALTASILEAAGFHQHKRQWRKKRDVKEGRSD